MNPHSFENSLETQVEQLRRELKRQKLTTIALFIAAIVAVSATRVVSQTGPRDLTLRTLRIVGADGKTKVLISGDAAMNQNGGSIAVFDNKDKVRVGVLAEAEGGSVSLLDNAGLPKAMLRFNGSSGSLGLGSEGSQTKVSVAANKNVSGMVVSGPNGKDQIVAGLGKNGGVVELYDLNGKLKR